MKAESIYESEAWIYEGSYVLETSTETLAIAINTGFTTKRGRIIRRILTREENQLQIFKSALIFFVENSILSFVAFGIYLALV